MTVWWPKCDLACTQLGGSESVCVRVQVQERGVHKHTQTGSRLGCDPKGISLSSKPLVELDFIS